MGGVFFVSSGKSNTYFKKTHFWGGIGSRWVDLGHWGVKNDRTGCGKAMETLPGPKMAITKIKKSQKTIENQKIPIFVYFPS